MVYKTTTYKQVITRVQRDFNLTGTNWIPAAIEWIGEALCEIGTHAHLERLSCELEVVSHRTPLPCNHESTLAVEFENTNLQKSGSIRYGKSEKFPLNNNGFNGDSFPLVIDNQMVNQDVKLVNSSYGQYYMENPDYIITSFETGTIVLHYQGYKLDEEGFPAVPDSVEHREALSFYILYKYLSRGNQHKVWDIAKAYEMWVKYKGKASNRARYPDIQSMERFTNMWSRIVMDKYAANKFFEDSSNKQSNFNI